MTETPLEGVRVLELARILAGPWAGQVLADLGAEVIKVESPAGDDTRGWGPPFVENPNGSRDAAYFHAANRGKRSVAIDFSTTEGRKRVMDLARDADVVIENFKVNGLEKFSLDFRSIAKINPRIIYCSISGFGQDGPYAARPGYDFVIQGMSGIMDVTGDPSGEPQKTGVAFADIFAGLYSVIAIQAALRHRENTGKGQHIDISLLDTMMGVLANQGLNYLVSGVSPERLGNMHPNIAPYESFATSDGWITIAVGNDSQFQRLCKVLERPDLVADPRYAHNEDRVINRKELHEAIGSIIRKYSRDEILGQLQFSGIPAGPINTVEQAFSDPQSQHRDIQLSMERKGSDRAIPGLRIPIRFSESSLGKSQPAPMLGNHDDGWK